MSCSSPDRGDRFCPAVSVLEYIWIDRSHTNLADTMTKLHLCMALNILLELLPIPGVGPHPLAVGTDRNKPAQHLDVSQRLLEFLCAHEQLLLSRLTCVPFGSYREGRSYACHELHWIDRFTDIVHRSCL